MAQTQAPPQETGGVKSLWLSKKGPLPVWGWALIVLAVVILFVMWRKGKASSTASTSATSTAQSATDTLGNQGAPPIFIVPPAPTPQVVIQAPTPGISHRDHDTQPPPAATVPPAPAGGGRDTPPGLPPAQTPPPAQPPAAPAATPPATTPSPSSPGAYVTVLKYTSSNPPWQSTLSGIFSYEKSRYGIPATSWQQIWNDPRNATLRSSRGAPQNIRPGDKVFVPGGKSS